MNENIFRFILNSNGFIYIIIVANEIVITLNTKNIFFCKVDLQLSNKRYKKEEHETIYQRE